MDPAASNSKLGAGVIDVLLLALTAGPFLLRSWLAPPYASGGLWAVPAILIVLVAMFLEAIHGVGIGGAMLRLKACNASGRPTTYCTRIMRVIIKFLPVILLFVAVLTAESAEAMLSNKQFRTFLGWFDPISVLVVLVDVLWSITVAAFLIFRRVLLWNYLLGVLIVRE